MISPLERYSDHEELLRQVLEGHQSSIWTSLPGIIQSYDPTKLTVTVQPAIKGIVEQPDGKQLPVNLPQLLDVPVVFPHGGGTNGGALTMPISAGDECILWFSSRCIDSWHQNGGYDNVPMEPRQHSLSDAFAMLGPYSQPKAISNVSTDKVQLRNSAGDTVIELDPSGQQVNVTAPGGVNITADTTITGNAHVDGPFSVEGNTVLVGTLQSSDFTGHGNANISGALTAASASLGTVSMGSMNVSGGSTLGAMTGPGGFSLDSSGKLGIGVTPRQQLSIGSNLDLYSNDSVLATKPAIRADSIGNLCLSGGAGDVYLNFDKGSGRTNFGDGNKNVMGFVGPAGGLNFPGLNISNAANVTFGSNYAPFAPTLTPDAPMTVASYAPSAYYIRIGPLVHFEYAFNVTFGGSPSSNFTMSLPFPPAGNINVPASIAINHIFINWAVGIATIEVGGFLRVKTIEGSSTGAWTNWAVGGNGYQVYISGTYRIA